MADAQDDPWSQFPDAGGTAVADAFAGFPDAEQTAVAQPELTPLAVESVTSGQVNQPTPTALPGPGNVPTPESERGLSSVLGTLLGFPAKTVLGTTNAALGTVTGDIFQNPDAYQATDADIQQPLVSGKTVSDVLTRAMTGGITNEIQPTGSLSSALKGIIEGTGNAAASATTPENLALLPTLAGLSGKAAARTIAGVFEGQALLGTPEQWKAIKEAETLSEKFRIGTEMGLGLAIPAAAFAHTFAGGREALPSAEARSATATDPRTPVQSEEIPVRSDVALPVESAAAKLPPDFAPPPEVIATTPEIARNKNVPVESEGGSAIAQGDLDALRRSNAERLGLPTEDLPPAMPTAPESVVAESAIARPASPEAVVQTVTEIGLSSKDLTNIPQSERAQYLVARGELKDNSHQKLSETGDAPLDALIADSGRPTGPQHAAFIGPGGEILTRAEMEKAGLPTHSQELQKAAPNEAVTSAAGPAEPVEAGGARVGQENGPVAQAPVESAVTQPAGAAVNEPILSPGPGAAAAAEPLASYELRRFGERFQEDQSIDPAIREQTGNRYYEPISNKVTVAEAEGIIERRGTDESIRLVRDESFPMQPRVRVTVGEALIKKLNQSYQEATKAGDIRAPEFLEQAVDTAEYLSGYGTTLGQGVQAFAIWNKLSPEGRLLEAQRIAKKSGVELTPEQAERIRKLNEEIEQAPEGFQKDEKTQDLLSFMSELKGVNPADVPTALWYSNILSGYSTQLVNTIDTALNVFSEAAAMAVSHPSRTPDIVAGLYQGLIKGGFEAASVLKTGRSKTGDKISQQRILERVKFGQEGGVPISTETPMGRFMKAAFESRPAAVLNLWKYPLRAMVASDTVFFNSFKEARARFLARGIAKTEGLSSDALYRRVEEALNQSPEVLDAALKQAQDEGLTGLNQRRRVGEIVEQGRAEGLTGDANEAAAIATYNHDPSGVLGLVAHNIANITEGFPLGRAIVPFTRIVANVANRGLNFTPWGWKRLFFGEWGGKKFATEPPVGDAYRSQLAKATLGTTAMATIALLDANETVQVTAKGPDNPEERKQMQNAGWKPYSVKVGNTYYSYQYTPFNLGFAMIGHYRDAIRYNKLSEKDASTRLAYGMLKSGSTIFDMSFLSGISDFVETIQGTTSSTKGAARLFSRTASSVAIPNLVKQIDKLFDPTIYQSDSITQSLIRETPIARSLTMKPMLNVLGEPIQPSQNRFFTFETNDPVWKFIVAKQAWVSVPSKTSKIRDRPIKPEEYYRLIQESGPMIRDYIASNLGRLNDMTGEEAQKDIRKQSDRFRDVVKSRF